MKKMILLLFFISTVFAQSKEEPSFPIIKYKKDKVKLWQYPEPESSLKVTATDLGEPNKLPVIGFAGGSNEHLVIMYQGEAYSLSRSKVVLDPAFDKRTATGVRCSDSNLGKNEQRAETTSVCER